MKNYFTKTVPLSFVFLLIILLVACSSPAPLQESSPETEETEETEHPTMNASLWMQHAAEYRALTSMIYRMAASNLSMALQDSYWTAYPNQEGKNIRKKPPAIIVDVDETVLNNAPFQARMILQNSDFDPEQWDSWVMEAQANAVPGALSFLNRAADEGVVIYYLTNREAKVEAGTRENLQKLGFPLSNNEDRILSNNEREDWTSAKTERRAYVAEKHRILMLFGDDLNDFISAKDITRHKRQMLVEQNQDKWGRQWFILPNPVYGSWEYALYDFDNSLSPSEIDSVRNARLETEN